MIELEPIYKGDYKKLFLKEKDTEMLFLISYKRYGSSKIDTFNISGLEEHINITLKQNWRSDDLKNKHINYYKNILNKLKEYKRDLILKNILNGNA